MIVKESEEIVSRIEELEQDPHKVHVKTRSDQAEQVTVYLGELRTIGDLRDQIFVLGGDLLKVDADVVLSSGGHDPTKQRQR